MCKYHFHVCSKANCNNCWMHCKHKKGNRKAHTCKKCGTIQWKKLRDSEERVVYKRK